MLWVITKWRSACSAHHPISFLKFIMSRCLSMVDKHQCSVGSPFCVQAANPPAMSVTAAKPCREEWSSTQFFLFFWDALWCSTQLDRPHQYEYLEDENCWKSIQRPSPKNGLAIFITCNKLLAHNKQAHYVELQLHDLFSSSSDNFQKMPSI